MAKDALPPPVPTEEDMKAIRAVKDQDLPWVPPPPSGENRYLKKMKENPFVPIGMSLQCLKLLIHQSGSTNQYGPRASANPPDWKDFLVLFCS